MRQSEWAAMVEAVRPRVVVRVTLPEGAPNKAPDVAAMAAWCASVEDCVVEGVNGLDFVPDRLGVMVAGPVQVAFAVGRALAHVQAKYRDDLEVVAFERSAAEVTPSTRWSSKLSQL